jgi:hypothetical protein
MNNAKQASCITQHFENDKVLRTNRPTRCRNVLFHRSTWFVRPDSFLAHKTAPHGLFALPTPSC